MLICECGLAAELVTGQFLYPNRPDLKDKWFYKCFDCDAWVGCHSGTKEPMGRLADAELRKWKVIAHKEFDKRWNFPGGKGSRSQRRGKAYRWLAHKMGIAKAECHIGMFTLNQCKLVFQICKHSEEKRRDSNQQNRGSVMRKPFSFKAT